MKLERVAVQTSPTAHLLPSDYQITFCLGSWKKQSRDSFLLNLKSNAVKPLYPKDLLISLDIATPIQEFSMNTGLLSKNQMQMLYQ